MRVGWLALAIVGTTWGDPALANACSLVEGPNLFDSTVAADGAVLIELGCESQDRCDATDRVRLSATDHAGTTVVLGPELVAWRPDAPLEPGSTLRLSLDAPGIVDAGPVEFDVDVSEPRGDMSPYGDVSVQIAARAFNLGTEICCRTSGGNSCGSNRCIGTEERISAVASIHPDLGLDGRERDLRRGQFVYRLRPTSGPEAEEPSPFSPLVARATFDHQASEYCVVLEAMHVGTGETFSEDEVCLPHGNMRDLGVFETPASKIADHKESCSESDGCAVTRLGVPGNDARWASLLVGSALVVLRRRRAPC